MRRSLAAAIVIASTVTLCLSPHAQSSALADLRAALGGDAVLSKISTIQVSGDVAHTVAARPGVGKITIAAVLPDRFIRNAELKWVPATIAEQPNASANSRVDVFELSKRPLPAVTLTFGDGSNFEEIRGVRGAEPIGYAPPRYAPKTPELAAQESQRRMRLLGEGRDAFARFSLAALGRGTAARGEPVETSDRMLQIDDSNGEVMELELDAVTHLPSRLRWRERTLASSLPAQVFESKFLDYGSVKFNGQSVMWPRRIVTTIDDEAFETIVVKKYEINGKIKDSTFDPHVRR